MEPEISVVIPSFNQKRTVEACLRALLAQKTTVPYEVIVADSSNNGTDDILRRYTPAITLLRSPERMYGGTALNRAIQQARGRIIACTSTNIIVDEHWIQQLHESHETHDVVGGRVLNGNPGSPIGWSLFLFEFSEFICDLDKVVVHMPTCNLSFKKMHLSKYGAFSDTHLSYDLIFTARIGAPIHFSRKVITRHLNRTDYPSVLKHAYLLGYGSATARESEALPGKVLLTYRFLIPALWAMRLLRIGYRAVRSDCFMMFLLTSPLVIGNLIAWNAGFWMRAMERSAFLRGIRCLLGAKARI